MVPVLYSIAGWYEKDEEAKILRETVLNLAYDLKQKEKDRFASIEAATSMRQAEERDGRGQPSQEVLDLEQFAANMSMSILASVEFVFDALVGEQWPTMRVPGMMRPPEARLHPLQGLCISAEACIAAIDEESRVMALRRLCFQLGKACTISGTAGREKAYGLPDEDERGYIIQALLKCLQAGERGMQDLASFTLAQIVLVVSDENAASDIVTSIMSFLDSVFKHDDGRQEHVDGMVSTLCELVASHAVRSPIDVLPKAFQLLSSTKTRPLGLEILRHFVNNHAVLSKDLSISDSGDGSSATILPDFHMLRIVENLCCLLEEPSCRSKSITAVLRQAVWTVDPLWATQKLCASMSRSGSPYELQRVLSALVCGHDDDDDEGKATWFRYDCYTSVSVLCAVVDCLEIGNGNYLEFNGTCKQQESENKTTTTTTTGSEHGNSGPAWVRRIITCIPKWSNRLAEKGSLGLALCSLAKKVFARPDACISIRVFSNLAKGVTKYPMEGVAAAQAAEVEMAQQSELNKNLLDHGPADMLRNLLFSRLSPLLILKALPHSVFVAINTARSCTLLELEDEEIDGDYEQVGGNNSSGMRME